MSIDYCALDLDLRADLQAAHRRCWERLARPGNWWRGADRVAIADAARAAERCGLCAARSQALSPASVSGVHDGGEDLSEAVRDVVHRVRMDSSRLSRAWFDSVVPSVMSEEAYVELVAIVASMATVDTFTRALGLAPHALPVPAEGEPRRYRPPGAAPGGAWVHMVAPEDVTADDPDMYAGKTGANIHRALSLVPDEMVGFFDLDDVHYLPDAQLRDFGRETRHITHAQIELLAARMSALNQCVY